MGKCNHDAGGGELSYAPRAPAVEPTTQSLVHGPALDGSRQLDDSRAAAGRLEINQNRARGWGLGPKADQSDTSLQAP